MCAGKELEDRQTEKEWAEMRVGVWKSEKLDKRGQGIIWANGVTRRREQKINYLSDSC